MTNRDSRSAAAEPAIRWLLAFAITVVALIVSSAAVYVAVKANEIAERQAEIAARDLQPIITANYGYRFRARRAETDFVTVQNLGAPAQAVNVDDIVLMTVTHATREATTRKVLVVKHYYASNAHSGAATGALVTLNGTDGNNQAITNLHRACSAYGKRNNSIVLIDLHIYLRVSYVDQLGESHTAFLKVSPVGGSAPVSPARGDKIFGLEDARPFPALQASVREMLQAANRTSRSPEQFHLG